MTTPQADQHGAEPQREGSTLRAGVDSGGTFTDIVTWADDGSVQIGKVPSTPQDPGAAVAHGVRLVVGSDRAGELRHGTTVPTNALLQRRGARTALVATEGFGDVIEIGRQRRPDLYDNDANRPEPLVPRDLRFGSPGRLDFQGQVLEEVGDLGGLVDRLRAAAPEAIAVCLLHAYANPAHELEVARALQAAGDWLVVRSSDVACEIREYERTSTTVLHAWLGPGTAGYLRRLQSHPGIPTRLLVMRSAGGLASADELAERPADALLSGPAAGALAAAAVAVGAGFPNAVGFDMGGTSTDVCLIVDGQPEQRSLTTVGGLPCLAPAVAIHTVGAGGGSVAAYDPGGALRVGPQSAGAEPGPACYGRGGTAPTVTDANVVLGRVRALVGGAMTLDRDAAVRALGTLDDDVAAAAEAVVAVVEATMERALREVTVQRGVSPADLAIVAFGGAGGLHAASLCAALGARAVVVPPRAGVLSAVGLLAAPVRADRSRTVLSSLDQLEPALLEELADEAVKEIAWAGEPLVGYLVDCRYRGQSHELTVPFEPGDRHSVVGARFHAEHERRNGYQRPQEAIEVVTLRARAEVPSPIDVARVLAAELPAPDATTGVVVVDEGGVGVVDRDRLPRGFEATGPLLVTALDATTWVPDGFTVRVDDLGNLILQVVAADAAGDHATEGGATSDNREDLR